MGELHRNLIGGEWVGGEAVPNINPSDTNDVVGDYARATKADAEAAIAAAKAAFPKWSRSGLLERHAVLRKASDEITRAQGRTRKAAVARGRQDAGRRHRRDGARCADLRLLRRRGAAADRRDGAERAAGRRRRDDARGGRRRRHHHAVEFPDRHSRLEDRAGALPRQHGRVQAGRPGARLRPGRSSTSCTAPACPRACSTSSWARARWSARRCSTAPTSTPSPSPARSAPASASRRPASSTCASSSSRWAARTRWSCSTMPIWRSPSTARSTAPSSRPASAARPRRG